MTSKVNVVIKNDVIKILSLTYLVFRVSWGGA